jgi:rod shape determining protein RodA
MSVFSYLSYRKRPIFFHKNWVLLTLFTVFVTLSVAGSHFIFHHVLKKHHTDMLSLWLRMEKDPRKLRYLRRDYGYNNDQSVKTIASGGWMGKGLLQGERTRGDFVPEQHTDYVFSAIGEEFGFVGTSFIILIYVMLILRLIWLAEHQRSSFSRIYGYSVASLLFTHFVINIGMVTDMLPTVGIPLPFISYGGSSLWGFTLLLFIFLRLNANRPYEL